MRGLRAGVGGCRAPAAPCLPSAPAMPCVADWLNNPFSIVQGIFGERGPGGAGILSAAALSGLSLTARERRARPGEVGSAGRAGGRVLLPRREPPPRRGLTGGARPWPAAGGPVPVPHGRAARSASAWQAGEGGKQKETKTYFGFREPYVLAIWVTDRW